MIPSSTCRYWQDDRSGSCRRSLSPPASYTTPRDTIILGLLLFVATVFPANAATFGQRYHTREPHACASMKAPTRGALSGAQAAQYIACLMEGGEVARLILVSNVRVEVGSGTRYNDLASIHRPGGAAPNAMIYNIRGSYKRYACEALLSQQAKLPGGRTPACSGDLLHHKFR